MIGCDLVRMVLIGCIPGSLAFGVPLWAVYILILGAALCSVVFNPARMAIVPDLVPAERLSASNSMVYASDRTVEIIGTLLAGALVAAFAAQAFYVDAVTFAVSALLLLRIDAEDRPRRALSWNGLIADAVDGVRILGANAILRANTVFSLLAQLAVPIVNGLTPVLIFREYRLGPEQYGVTEAAIAVGAVGAGILYPVLLGGIRKGAAIVGGFVMLGLVLIGIAASPGFYISVLLFTLLGVANVIFFIPNVTLSQEVTPPELRARVFASRTALLHLSWLPVVLASGLIAEVLPVPVLIGAAGVFTLGVAVLGGLFRSVRDVP
jgi:hypothetical protein